MLGLGMASSHAPMMFQKAQYWPRVVGRIPAEAREQLPRSAREEIGRAHHDRRRSGRSVRRRQQSHVLGLHRRGAPVGPERPGQLRHAAGGADQARLPAPSRTVPAPAPRAGQARLRHGQHRPLRSARQSHARGLAHGLEPGARGGSGPRDPAGLRVHERVLPAAPRCGPLRAPGRGHRGRLPRPPGAHRDLRVGRPLPLPGHVQRGLDRPAARPVDPRAARAQRSRGDGASVHVRLRCHALRHG